MSKYDIIINCEHKTIYTLRCPTKNLEIVMDIYTKNIKQVFGENEYISRAYHSSFEFSASKAYIQIDHCEVSRRLPELNVELMQAIAKSIREISEIK